MTLILKLQICTWTIFSFIIFKEFFFSKIKAICHVKLIWLKCSHSLKFYVICLLHRNLFSFFFFCAIAKNKWMVIVKKLLFDEYWANNEQCHFHWPIFFPARGWQNFELLKRRKNFQLNFILTFLSILRQWVDYWGNWGNKKILFSVSLLCFE